MRLPRRSRLAAPFVIIVVGMGGCAPEPVVNPPGPPEPHVNPPPPQPPQSPPEPHVNPPPPQPPPQPPPEPHVNPPPPLPRPPRTSVIHVNPPPPQHPVPDLPVPDDPAHVYRQPDGTCMQAHDIKCPPQANCNPPPPYPVLCPPGK